MWRMYTLCVPLLVSKIFNKLTIVSQYKIQKHTYIYTHIHINWSLCWSKNLSHHFSALLQMWLWKGNLSIFRLRQKQKISHQKIFSSCLEFKNVEKIWKIKDNICFCSWIIDRYTNRISILKWFVPETIRKEIIR